MAMIANTRNAKRAGRIHLFGRGDEWFVCVIVY